MALADKSRLTITKLSGETQPGPALYEPGHCARGDMENRIKVQQLARFGW